MAPRKKAASASADRLSDYAKGKTQAGKPKASGTSKSATITRQMQNKGVKDGTIKLGKSGKTYNVYDAKSGTWKKGVVKAAGTERPRNAAEGPKKSMPKGTKAKGWHWGYTPAKTEGWAWRKSESQRQSR